MERSEVGRKAFEGGIEYRDCLIGLALQSIQNKVGYIKEVEKKKSPYGRICSPS